MDGVAAGDLLLAAAAALFELVVLALAPRGREPRCRDRRSRLALRVEKLRLLAEL